MFRFQVPPDGEFPVMNYRMTQEFKPPFHVNTLIEEAGRLKVQSDGYTSSGQMIYKSLSQCLIRISLCLLKFRPK